ncbi:MAG: HAMP domain-containing protein [Gammaproteobacteria bacterium]|nr:HAMP domain-containing protein [Gammaproteobacteria bacterium]
MSLQRRLLVVLLLAALVTTLTATTATWYWARHEVDQLLDYQLRQQALSLEDKAYLLGSVAVVDPDPEQQIVTQLWDRRGVLRYQSHPGVVLSLPSQLGYSSAPGDPSQWRVYAMQLGPWIVQLAQPLSIRRNIATNAALHMLYPTLAVLPLLALLIGWAVGRVLAPISALASAISRRDPAALEPLPHQDLPQEVGLMAEALNDLIARQREVLARQQEFMADAAHELRTPLMAIALQAQLLTRVPTAAERGEVLEELRLGIARSTTLLERLMAVARLDSADAHAAFTPLELAPLLARSRQEVAALAAARQIDLVIAVAAGVVIDGEARSLAGLCVNLLENALRYTPEGGRVVASATTTSQGVCLSVTDNGPGIPQAERARVFERFYRVPGTVPAGSGLGLAIVKRVAELHGGSVTIDDAPGGGAQVRVDFPPPASARHP